MNPWAQKRLWELRRDNFKKQNKIQCFFVCFANLELFAHEFNWVVFEIVHETKVQHCVANIEKWCRHFWLKFILDWWKQHTTDQMCIFEHFVHIACIAMLKMRRQTEISTELFRCNLTPCTALENISLNFITKIHIIEFCN